jgi:nitroreductase
MPLPSFAKLLAAPLPAPLQQMLRSRYRSIRDVLGVWKAGRHDAYWYSRFSGLRGSDRKGVLQARIIKAYHRVEKGLALSAPRPGFGADAIASLIQDLGAYRQRFGDDHIVRRGLQTLAEYQVFNLGMGTMVPEVARLLSSCAYSAGQPGEAEGGTMEVTRAGIHAAARIDLNTFFQSRYSIRQFSAEAVAETLIEQAIRMAQKTPSVCNREAGRVFLVADKQRAAELLAHQNGNRGFGEQADKLLVITASLDCFLTVGERYQCWIDGGLFAMSLIYALHSLGLGSCCLNWSVEPQTDSAFKRAAGIPEDQAIIMLLAVGHLPERFRVAISARRPLEDILTRL